MPTSRHFTTLLASGAFVLLAITATLFVTAGAAAAPMTMKLAPAPTTEHTGATRQPVAKTKPLTLISRRYIVKKGDTLTRIAVKLYGQAPRRAEIWWINRKHISNPNLIFVGESLRTNNVKPPQWMTRRFNEASAPSVTASHTPTTTVSYTPVTAPAPIGSFESCVMQRESGGDPTAYNTSSGASGLFGMLLSFWDGIDGGYFGHLYPGGASTAPYGVQLSAFSDAYAEDGTAPWAPYDGC